MMLMAEFRRLFMRRHIQIILTAVCVCAVLYGVFLRTAARRADQNYIHYQQEYLLENWQSVLDSRKAALKAQEYSVLFSDPHEQAVILKEREVIAGLETIRLKEVNDSVFHQAVSSNRYIALILILTGLILIQDLFIEDRSEDLCVLYSTALVSGLRRGLGRMMVMLAVYAAVCLAFFAVQLISTRDLNGMPVQNIRGFALTNGTWTVMEALMILFLFTVFSALIIIAVCLLCVMLTGKTGLGLTIAAGAVFCEYLIAAYMSVTSRFALLKTWNPVTWMMSESIPGGFTVLGYKAFAEPYTVLLVLAVLTIASLCICWLVYAGNEKRPSVFRMNLPLIRIRRITIFHLRELLFEKRGLAVFLLTAGFCMAQMLNYKVIRTPAQAGLEAFRSRYYGRINDSLLTRIEKDRSDINAAREEADTLYMQWTDGGADPERMSEEQHYTLSQLMETGSHTDEIAAVYEEVMELKEAGETEYINREGLELLAGKNDPSIHLFNFFLCTLPVLLLSVVFTHSQLRSLFRSTVVNETGILRNKYILLCTAGLLMIAAVYGSHALKILRNYDVRFSGTVRQLGISMDLPVMYYFVLYLINVICIQFTLIRAAVYFACRMKSSAAAAAVCGIAAAGAVLPWTGFLISWSYPARPVRYAVIIGIIVTVNIFSAIINMRHSNGRS